MWGKYRSLDNQGSVMQEFDPGLEKDIYGHTIILEEISFQVSVLNARKFFEMGGFDPEITGIDDHIRDGALPS